MPQALWRRVTFFISCLLLIMVSGSVAAALPAAGSPFYFLALSDIHFDPFATCRGIGNKSCPLIKQLRAKPASAWGPILAAADTALPRTRRDANYVLLKQTLKEAQQAALTMHPDFVLVLGDTLGHDFRRYYKRYAGDRSQAGFQNFVKKTLEFINLSLASTFPLTNVYMVVGNNDTYSANYQSVPGGEFFHDAGSLWSTLIQDPAARARMRNDFAEAGYYALDVPAHPSLRLVVLNSILFSKRSSGERSLQAATRQMDWLHQQLQQAEDRQQQVFIVMHIPPRIDVYLMGRFRLFTARQFYKPVFMEQLMTELRAFSPQVIALMSGHLHRDWTHGLPLGSHRDLPVISVPSVSPIFGNDPAFKVYHYVPAVARIDSIYTYTDAIQQDQSWRKVRSLK